LKNRTPRATPRPNRVVSALWAMLLSLTIVLSACTLPGQPVDPPTPTPTTAPPTATTSPTARVAQASASGSPTQATAASPAVTNTRPAATPTTSPTAARGSASPTRATPTSGTPGRATPGGGTPTGQGTPSATRTPFTPTAEEPCVVSDFEVPPLSEGTAAVATIEQAYRCLLLNHVSRNTTLDHKVLLNGAWDIFKEAGLPAADAAPLVLTGDREADWDVYETRFNALIRKYGKQLEEPLARVAIQGMAQSLDDNHVAYLEPKLWQRFFGELSGDEKEIGPGFLLAIDEPTGKFYAHEVYPDTPAARNGLKAGDVIDTVNGTQALKGVGNQGLYDLLTGDVGTRATMRVTRPSTGQTLTIQASVAEYTLPLIESRVLEGGIGYIRLRHFSTTAGEEFDQALAALQAQGIKSLIFDVRQNPGGSTDALRHILSHFTHQGPHAITIDENGKREEENPDPSVPLLNLPWLVLADSGSASSSDITAAVAKDRGGWLIGTKTSGSLGSAQIFELADGSALEITVRLVLGPNGEEINEIGVTPNEEVPLTPANISAGNDTQLAAAIAYLKAR
jgi:carboxyl-terminal processing protease